MMPEFHLIYGMFFDLISRKSDNHFTHGSQCFVPQLMVRLCGYRVTYEPNVTAALVKTAKRDNIYLRELRVNNACYSHLQTVKR